MKDLRELAPMVERLLNDRQYVGHPLREALAQVYLQSLEHVRRLERVVRVSDGYQSMLQSTSQEARKAATHDPLTGIGNRSLLVERLHEESSRVMRSQRPYVLLMLDVDDFKTINDTWGHATGDHVLIELSRVMQNSIRHHDLCGRWGGEEFVLILPETTLTDAKPLVERLCKHINALNVKVDDADIAVTVSVGVVAHHVGEDFAQTLHRADQAMLEAKRGGKNRYVFHQR